MTDQVVSNTILLPGGAAVVGARVTVTLVASTTAQAEGFTATTGVAFQAETTTNSAGLWTLTLTPNSLISPSGTVYKAVEVYGGTRVTNHFTVPASGTPHLLGAILSDAPASLATAALQAHIDDAVDAHDATAISYAGGTGISATTVEGALDELATEKLDITTASSTYEAAAAARPSWASGTRRWDAQRGWYNVTPATLSKWVAAAFGMLAGSAHARITCLGDSTWQGSSANPNSTYAIPAALKSMLMTDLGVVSGGTGMLPFWNTYEFASGATGTSNPASEPRLYFARNTANGNLTFPSGGLYTTGMMALNDSGAQTNYVIFAPGIAYDDFYIYAVEGGGRSYLVEMGSSTTVAGGAENYYNLSAYYGDVSAPPGGTNVAALSGYQRDSAGGSGGQRVGKITFSNGTHNVRIMDNLNADASTSYFLGAEARISNAGLIVDNYAQSGRALRNLAQNSNNTNGVGGAPLVEMLHPDLLIIPLMLNDYQASVSVATFKTDLTALVQRQKTSGATGTYGNGVGADGDVLLFVSAQPNAATWPPTPPTTTLTDYYAAAYQVADEQNVALVDGAWRWQNYATSSVLMSDGVHPNQYGSRNHARNVADALLSVVGGL